MACMSSILQSHGNMDPDPNLHLSSQDTPFCLIICLFAPVRLSLIVHSFACFLSSFFFACLLFCFLCHYMYTLEARTLGVRALILRHEKKGKDASKRTQAQKGQCSIDQEVQPPRVVISLSLSLSLEPCFRVLILISSFRPLSQGMKYVCFIFPVPCQAIPF